MLKIFYVFALLAALAATASSANAVTWDNSGDTAFTATGGPMTYSATSTSLSCPVSESTVTVTATPATGAFWTAMTITTTYTGCTVSGQSWPWECRRTFTAQSQPSADVTSGTMDTTCDVYAGGTKTCHVTGSQPATYVNPIGPATVGRFALSNGTFRIFHGIVACLLGNGDLLTISLETIHITSATGGPSPHLGPIITRTA